MNGLALGVHRLVLRAYPRVFRQAFGVEMQRLLVDRHRHDGTSLGRLLVRELTDAATAAPLMRWEHEMAQTTWSMAAVAVAAVVGLSGGPLLFLPLALAGAS